jgi:hypothetical protein
LIQIKGAGLLGGAALFVLAPLSEDHMRDVSKMKFLCSVFCEQYQSDAKFYVDETRLSGVRNLVVVYEKGGYGGDKEFTAGIPNAWSNQDVENLILLPMKSEAPYPAWEVSARVFGSPLVA